MGQSTSCTCLGAYDISLASGSWFEQIIVGPIWEAEIGFGLSVESSTITLQEFWIFCVSCVMNMSSYRSDFLNVKWWGRDKFLLVQPPTGYIIIVTRFLNSIGHVFIVTSISKLAFSVFNFDRLITLELFEGYIKLIFCLQNLRLWIILVREGHRSWRLQSCYCKKMVGLVSTGALDPGFLICRCGVLQWS